MKTFCLVYAHISSGNNCPRIQLQVPPAHVLGSVCDVKVWHRTMGFVIKVSNCGILFAVLSWNAGHDGSTPLHVQCNSSKA